MTQKRNKNDETKVTVEAAELRFVLMEQKDFLAPIVEQAVQTILELEMEECVQAGRYERNEDRAGHRSGYYRRKLVTRVGMLGLRVRQDRAGHFQHASVPAIAAKREGVGGSVGPDVCAGGFHAQGGGDYAAMSLARRASAPSRRSWMRS